MLRYWLIICQITTVSIGLALVAWAINLQITLPSPEPEAQVSFQKAARIAGASVVKVCRMPMTRGCTGSGIIMNSSGHILTNDHVLVSGEDMQIQLIDGQRTKVSLVATDPESDLALLKANLKFLPDIPKNDAYTLSLGEPVLAIGNPMDSGLSFTSGIVSAIGELIVIDSSINRGNSGGALVNSQGELVGVISASHYSTNGICGMGYAIPVKVAKRVMSDLLEHGIVIRGWIGVEPEELTPELAKDTDLDGGIVIIDIRKNGPAYKAGLRIGDIITEVDGNTTSSLSNFMRTISDLVPGVGIDFHVQRGQKKLTLRLIPEQRPKSDFDNL